MQGVGDSAKSDYCIHIGDHVWDRCSAATQDGVTTYGCNTKEMCDDTDSKWLKCCTGDNCNSESFANASSNIFVASFTVVLVVVNAMVNH